MGRPRTRDGAMRRRSRDGALDLLAAAGPSAVTTRAVAARADTSLAAVDELFGGKGGLVQAMFTAGFGRLATTLDAVPTTGDPEADLVTTALTFRRFALEHRHLFEVMFSRPFAEFDPGPDDRAAAAVVHRTVTERVDAVLDPHAGAVTRHDAAIGLVAALHGLAQMELAGILGSTPESCERRWRETVLVVVAGLRGRSQEARR